MSIDVKDIVVNIPGIDVRISDPFNIDLNQLLLTPIVNLDVKISIHPILTVDIPVIDKSVDDMVNIIGYNLVDFTNMSFDDVLTNVPLIDREVVSYNDEVKDWIQRYLNREFVLKLEIKPSKIVFEKIAPSRITIPSAIGEKYAIKLKLSKIPQYELKEILESGLTKELKITRMIKRMEIVKDHRIIYELEKLHELYYKKLKRR